MLNFVQTVNQHKVSSSRSAECTSTRTHCTTELYCSNVWLELHAEWFFFAHFWPEKFVASLGDSCVSSSGGSFHFKWIPFRPNRMLFSCFWPVLTWFPSQNSPYSFLCICTGYRRGERAGPQRAEAAGPAARHGLQVPRRRHQHLRPRPVQRGLRLQDVHARLPRRPVRHQDQQGTAAAAAKRFP